MLGLDIATGRLAQMPGGGQEAAMLARAIIMGGGRIGRQMRAAFEILAPQPGAAEPRSDGRDMRRLAVMRGAGQCQLLGTAAIAVGGAALDQRQGLERLDGGAGIDRTLDIAPGPNDL